MSVATKNSFALLDEDTRPSTPPPPTPTPPQQSQPNRARGRGGPASRGGRYYQRGGAAPPPSTPPADDQPSLDPKPRRFDEHREDRARGRGRGGFRGRGRPFDKHSATGKTDSEKKVHNSWGGDDGETERKVEEAANDDAAAENLIISPGLNDWAAPDQATATDDWGVPAPDFTPSVDPTEKPQTSDRREKRADREDEEEDNTLTLDQYNAQQREKAVVATLDIRKPNDGVGDDLSVLQKVDDLVYYPGKQRSTNKSRDKDKKEQKVLVEIDLHFEPTARGGRGGRGGDRGGERGRGRGGRGRPVTNGYSPPVVLNVDDQIAFPSLS